MIKKVHIGLFFYKHQQKNNHHILPESRTQRWEGVEDGSLSSDFLGPPDQGKWMVKTLSGPNVFQMGVSKNRGTPKWMVYNGKPY